MWYGTYKFLWNAEAIFIYLECLEIYCIKQRSIPDTKDQSFERVHKYLHLSILLGKPNACKYCMCASLVHQVLYHHFKFHDQVQYFCTWSRKWSSHPSSVDDGDWGASSMASTVVVVDSIDTHWRKPAGTSTFTAAPPPCIDSLNFRYCCYTHPVIQKLIS